MKPEAIEQLIERFLAGETSLREEETLREYFVHGDVPEKYADLQAQFSLLGSFGREELPEGFEARLIGGRQTGKAVNMRLFTQYWIPAVAATVLLLIAIFFGTDLLQSKEVYGNITDPGMAFVETRSVLEDVSKKMNKGLEPAKKTVDKVENSVQKAAEINQMNKALEKAKNIDKLENASELLKSLNKVYIRVGNS